MSFGDSPCTPYQYQIAKSTQRIDDVVEPESNISDPRYSGPFGNPCKLMAHHHKKELSVGEILMGVLAYDCLF